LRNGVHVKTNNASGDFELPPKIDRYLAVLNELYHKNGQPLLQQIVVNGAPSIHENRDYDNWNGGTYGHALTLTLPEDLYLEVIDSKNSSQDQLCKDMNRLNSRS
jgi:hypothetical protein